MADSGRKSPRICVRRIDDAVGGRRAAAEEAVKGEGEVAGEAVAGGGAHHPGGAALDAGGRDRQAMNDGGEGAAGAVDGGGREQGTETTRAVLPPAVGAVESQAAF